MSTGIACELRQWLADIRLIFEKSSIERNKVAILVHAYNWATDPSAFRTDREHRACRRLARLARRRLEGMRGWHESESGHLWC